MDGVITVPADVDQRTIRLRVSRMVERAAGDLVRAAGERGEGWAEYVQLLGCASLPADADVDLCSRRVRA